MCLSKLKTSPTYSLIQLASSIGFYADSVIKDLSESSIDTIYINTFIGCIQN
jgi:hypothetical protein